ncbi:MAG: MarR family winged helix-turn-helix transcriptional regulator [Actinomycetales bacterium]
MQHDEVDGIIDAWRRERPDVDSSPLEVLSRVTRLSHRLGALRRQVFARHDLENWEFDVLAALRRSGEPYALSPGRLSTETLVTSGTMTNRIDRLAERSLVRRTPSRTDRRGVRVQLTPAGRDLVDAAFADLVGVERAMLADLSVQDREQLAQRLRALLIALG